MSGNVYKKLELVGTSNESLEGAINNAVEKASKTLRGLSWFEVQELRGHISDGKVSEFQVTMQVGMKLDD